VTLDIEKCYDSVDVRKLKEFLHKTDLLEKEYYLVNTIVLKRKNNVQKMLKGQVLNDLDYIT